MHSKNQDLDNLRTPLRDGLNKFHGELVMQLEKLERYKEVRFVRPENHEAVKKKILAKTRNIEVLKSQIAFLRSENQTQRENLKVFKGFVEERENSIKNVEIIQAATTSNTNKKSTLEDRRSNHNRFKLMYDLKIRSIFQQIYAIFFNKGTADIKRSLRALKKPEGTPLPPKLVDQVNTAVGFLVLIIMTVNRIIRINYACMYRYTGSRNSLIVKDAREGRRPNFDCWIDSRYLEFAKVRPFMDCILTDAVRILEIFKVSLSRIQQILNEMDAEGFVEALKAVLFQRLFAEPAPQLAAS